MKLQHSKGTWEYRYGTPGVEHNFYLLLGAAKVFLKRPADCYPTIEGDFALMSAAPDLLSTGQRLLRHAKSHPDLAPYCEAMAQAIRKATERPEGANEPVNTVKAPEEPAPEEPNPYRTPEGMALMSAVLNVAHDTQAAVRDIETALAILKGKTADAS